MQAHTPKPKWYESTLGAAILGAIFGSIIGAIASAVTTIIVNDYEDCKQQQSLVSALLVDITNLETSDDAMQSAWNKAMVALMAVDDISKTAGGRQWLMAEVLEPTSTAVFDANASRIGSLPKDVAGEAFQSYSLYAEYKAHMRLLASPAMPFANKDEKKRELDRFNDIPSRRRRTR